MQRTTLLAIITLIECPIAILCSFYSFFIFTGMLFASLRSKSTKFSPSMQIYAILQVILTLFTIVYLLYLSVQWRLDHSVYNPYWLYYTGGLQNSFLIITSLAVCILGIDRCLLVKFPTKKLTTIPLIMFTLMTIVLSAIHIALRMVPAYPKNMIDKGSCGNFGCLATHSQNGIYAILRFFTGGINFVVGIVLALMFKQMTLVNNCTAKSSKTALLTIVITIVFDLLPHLLMVIIYRVFDVNLGDYTGPYSTVIGAVESAVCALFYRNSFKFDRSCFSGLTESQHTTTSVPAIKTVTRNRCRTIACEIR
uniref:G_PROTEIN_RECEP_F1_2 domain-containing protein n=1 Tax=Panagrellus redivivus TaxID=6233 RepID=A0A7E4V1E3_PANRE